MENKFVRTTLEEIMPLMAEYLDTLTSLVDDYWEHHVRNAVFYKIMDEEKCIGYFAIYEKEMLLSQFYLQSLYLNQAQTIFKQVIEVCKVNSAYVVTGDQLFLSLAMDHYLRIELQAYYFDGTVTAKVRPPEYPRSALHPVGPEELEEVLEKTGDFFQPISKTQLETGEYLLYKLCDEKTILGYGIIVPNTLKKEYWPCGMITLEENRKKGIGRSIQLHLGDICRENGYIPIAGCWYYNHLSKKTIESAGRYSRTRLLKFIFREEEDATKEQNTTVE